MLETIKKTLTKFQKSHIALAVLFILYLILDIHLPKPIASMVDTTLGNVIVVIAALSLFYVKNNIVAVLGLVVAYEMIRRSSGVFGLMNHVPTQAQKDKIMEKLNDKIVHETLEEEMASNILPLVSGESGPSTYEPVLDNIYSATAV